MSQTCSEVDVSNALAQGSSPALSTRAGQLQLAALLCSTVTAAALSQSVSA